MAWSPAHSDTPGQKCWPASRVIVLASIYDAFVNRLLEATKSLKVGPAESRGISSAR